MSIESLSAALAALTDRVSALEGHTGLVTKLSWAPPKDWETWTEIKVTDSKRTVKLSTAGNYRITLPADKPVNGPVVLWSSRDVDTKVVLIGGAINAPGERALHLNLQGSSFVHVEGVDLHGEGLEEGINIDSRRAGSVYQLQNIRCSQVHGTRATNHADVLQSWAGPTTLRIDRIEGATNYQGFFLDPYKFMPGSTIKDWVVRNVLIRGVEGMGYGFWLTGSTPLTAENCVLASDHGGLVYGKNWGDGVKKVPAAEGESVLTANPGLGYVSPGYRS